MNTPDNLNHFDPARTLAAINQAAFACGLFGEPDIKSRASPSTASRSASAPPARFAHVRIALLAGRSDLETQGTGRAVSALDRLARMSRQEQKSSSASKPSISTARATPRPSSMAERPVFFVEDDAAVRKGCEQALSLADSPVRGFADGETMLAALASASPALVVSDVRLPGTGRPDAALRELRQHDRELRAADHRPPAMWRCGRRNARRAYISSKTLPLGRLVAAAKARWRNEPHSENVSSRSAWVTASQHRRQSPASSTSAAGHHAAPTASTPAQRRKRQRKESSPAPSTRPADGAGLSSRSIGRAAGNRLSRANCSARGGRLHRCRQRPSGGSSMPTRHAVPRRNRIDAPTCRSRAAARLQERSVERLGSNTAIPVDCRLVAASKTDLKAASAAGQFRADLYYRLNVVSIDLLPLRQRREDIPLLMARFLQEAASRYQRPLAAWTPADLVRWMAHDWPGNVRELKNVADRWALGLPDMLAPVPESGPLSLNAQVDAAERRVIETALRQCDGNVASRRMAPDARNVYDKAHQQPSWRAIPPRPGGCELCRRTDVASARYRLCLPSARERQ